MTQRIVYRVETQGLTLGSERLDKGQFVDPREWQDRNLHSHAERGDLTELRMSTEELRRRQAEQEARLEFRDAQHEAKRQLNERVREAQAAYEAATTAANAEYENAVEEARRERDRRVREIRQSED